MFIVNDPQLLEAWRVAVSVVNVMYGWVRNVCVSVECKKETNPKTRSNVEQRERERERMVSGIYNLVEGHSLTASTCRNQSPASWWAEREGS